MNSSREKGYWRKSALEVALIVVVLVGAGWYFYQREASSRSATASSAAYTFHPRAHERVGDPNFCSEQLEKWKASGLIVLRPDVNDLFVDEPKWEAMPIANRRMVAAVARCSVVNGYLYRSWRGDFAMIKGFQSRKPLAIATVEGVYLPGIDK